VSAPPEVGPLDGIVNLGLYAASETDVHLVAWEPFKPRDQRQPYLAHFDGKAWAQVETGIPGGLMSVSGTPSGALFIAAGAALYKRESAAAAWKPVPLPALLFSSTPARGAVWIHTVRAISEDDVWVEGTYRVKLPDPKSGDVEARASALYHWGTPMPTLYCDAREPAENALSIVEKP